MQPPPDQIASMAVFAQVVEHGSLRAAARALGLSKSQVSARLQKLEEWLGVRLLLRTTRRLSLTADGARVLEGCSRVAAAATEAARGASGREGAPQGLVRTSAPVALGVRWLAGPIAAFLARHPQVRVELSLGDRPVDLVAEGFDLAVRSGGRLADSSLLARRIARDRRVLCASPAYLARRGEPRSAAEIPQHDCLGFSLIRRSAEWRFRGERGPLALEIPGRFVSDSSLMVRAAALAGIGLGVLPLSMCADDLATGRLRPLLPRELEAPGLSLWTLLAPARRQPAQVAAFAAHLAAAFSPPPWETGAPGGPL